MSKIFGIKSYDNLNTKKDDYDTKLALYISSVRCNDLKSIPPDFFLPIGIKDPYKDDLRFILTKPLILIDNYVLYKVIHRTKGTSYPIISTIGTKIDIIIASSDREAIWRFTRLWLESEKDEEY